MTELNFSLAEFPETHNHRGDTTEYERALSRYLLNYGSKALRAIKAAGINRNLLITESAYQIMRACEQIDEQGRLPPEPCFPTLQQHFMELSVHDLRNDTGKHNNVLEATGLTDLAMEAMHHNFDMSETILRDYSSSIIGAYHHKAKLNILYAQFEALKKPGTSLDRVTVAAGRTME